MQSKRVLSFALVAWALAACVSASDDPTESLSGVQDLTPDNFDKVVNGLTHAIVEFYAPWCGHCKRMVPEYKKLGELVESDPTLKGRVTIAKVNADTHRSLGERFDVRGFPTIKYFARGKPVNKENVADYNEARTAVKFVEFLKEKLAEDKAAYHVEELAEIAEKFAAAEDKAALLAEAKAKVAALEGDKKSNGELYLSYMEKAISKGAEYIGKEKARLEKLMAGGSIHSSKVSEMAKKISVLGAFTESK